jgi:hypothetical protein
MSRAEDRTPNTRDCPDTEHTHQWVKRPPELTEGAKLGVAYTANADGTVVFSEEALSELLRMAGFVPRAQDRGRRPDRFLVSTPRDMPHGVFDKPLGNGPPPPPAKPDPLPNPVQR